MDNKTTGRLQRLAQEREILVRERAHTPDQVRLRKNKEGTYHLSDITPALSLQQLCYDDGWIDPDFDWAVWIQSAEYAALRNDGTLRGASSDQLIKLLTATIRQERFNAGTLAEALRSGLLQRVTERAAILASSQP